MTPERWQRVKSALVVALELTPASRAAYLDQACAGDQPLRDELDRLLTANELAGAGFLSLPAMPPEPCERVQQEPDPWIGRRVGAYEVVAPLGAGGMGQVYRARDTRLKRDVAIKVLPGNFATDPDRLARFQREAKLLAALNHPNIAAVYGLEESGGAMAIVLELVEGKTLAARLLDGPLPVADALPIARQIVDALDGAQERGIVHRDLKPANIIITPRGAVKVLDFGLAKEIVADGSSSEPRDSAAITVTRPSACVVLGTAAYMSPEQARGQPVDKQTDIWSFGCVLYEMLTGRSAFAGDTAIDTIAAILKREPDWNALPSGLPSSVERLIHRCLEKERHQRARSLAELRAGLGQPGADAAAAALSSDAQVVLAIAKRHRRPIAGTVLGLLALAGVLYAVVLRRPLPPPATSASATAATILSLQDLQITQVTTSGNAERPAISPDGKYVAYVQHDGNDYSVRIRQTETNSNVQIVRPEPGVTLLALTVTPDGNFVDFVTGPIPRVTLWRVPFLGGTARKLVDQVWSPIAWSPDGQHMAFVGRLSEGTYALIVTDPDGSHEHTLATRRNPAAFRSFSESQWPSIGWSPNGRLIALRGYRRGLDLSEEVVVVDVATAATQAVPLLLRGAGGVAWLNDESLMLNQPNDAGTVQLWRLSYPGGQLSRLTNDLIDYTQISLTADRDSFVTAREDRRVSIWVGDGAAKSGMDMPGPYAGTGRSTGFVAWAKGRFLYTTSANGRTIISSVLPEGGTPEEFIPNAAEPDASADGRTVVFQATDTGDRTGIWKVNADGRQPIRLLTESAAPRLTPDGRYVVFLSSRSGVQSPWIVSTEGGSPVQLTNAFVPGHALDVSADSRALVFATVATNPSVVVCDLPACTAQRTVTIPPRARGRIRWTPNGRGVAIIDPSGSNVTVQPLDGKPSYQLTHFTDRTIIDFAWSPDGQRLGISRATTTNDIVLFKGLKR
jgi:serine/threonine protein kinase/Tol biopolymer transport system component